MRKYIAGDLVIPEMQVWALRGLALRDPDQEAFKFRRPEQET
jgi:hypothetical protein